MKDTNDLPYLSPPETAKLLRKALNTAFPGTKFSLRMSRGTGHGNYHISWTGGPESHHVADVAIPFEGRGFDGSDDSTTHHRTRIERDGEQFRSGIGMILTHRSA